MLGSLMKGVAGGDFNDLGDCGESGGGIDCAEWVDAAEEGMTVSRREGSWSSGPSSIKSAGSASGKDVFIGESEELCNNCALRSWKRTTRSGSCVARIWCGWN